MSLVALVMMISKQLCTPLRWRCGIPLVGPGLGVGTPFPEPWIVVEALCDVVTHVAAGLCSTSRVQGPLRRPLGSAELDSQSMILLDTTTPW